MNLCPWCDGETNHLGCQRGCHDRPIFSNRCIDCRREFHTGRFGADQCRDCEQKENAQYTKEAEGDRTLHTGYEADMRRKGASRRAHALGKEQEHDFVARVESKR